MGDARITIDSGMIHIKGAGKGLTRIYRNDNIAKFQISGGARNVFIEHSPCWQGAGDGIVVTGVLRWTTRDQGVGGFGACCRSVYLRDRKMRDTEQRLPRRVGRRRGQFRMVRDTVISENDSDGCVSVNGGHRVLTVRQSASE